MPGPSKPCKFCGSLSHWPFQCFQRPKSKVLQKPRKAIQKHGPVAKRWMAVRGDWLTQNTGPWKCHYCGRSLDITDITLDHLESRSRRPDLRYDLGNLVPCCWSCNGLKGSVSHSEYPHACHV